MCRRLVNYPANASVLDAWSNWNRINLLSLICRNSRSKRFKSQYYSSFDLQMCEIIIQGVRGWMGCKGE